MFVSGSQQTGGDGDAAFADLCDRLAAEIADRSWELASLGGNAGWLVTSSVARIRKAADGEYVPEKLVFHFRDQPSQAPTLPGRYGTAVYSHLDRLPLVDKVLEDCRALLSVGGGTRTAEEMRRAEALGVGVVPLAVSGGAARAYWQEHSADEVQIGGKGVEPRTWAQLADPTVSVAVKAAARLVRQAMYETD